MLCSLSIRDIVLIEKLTLGFNKGLNVLTGETGAGKSILLDALGFALGQKVRRNLVRAGADGGNVVAEFSVASDHPVHNVLRDLDLSVDGGDIILRRNASADGPSRAFVNDQRVSTNALQQVGAMLVEVHGQHDDRGLLSPRAHRPLLDAFGGLDRRVAAVRTAWTGWKTAERALDEAQTALATAAAEADFLRHSVAELEKLAPESGEEEVLDSRRRLIRQAVGLSEEINRAADQLSTQGAEGLISEALSRLTHIAEKAEGRLEGTIAAVDRTLTELGEAQSGLSALHDALRFDPGELEAVEERLFAIRGLARKHNVQPDELPSLAERMVTQLTMIDAGEDRIEVLKAELDAAKKTYDQAAEDLSRRRVDQGARLDEAVTGELKPLKMENARFLTTLEPTEPGPEGTDAVRFTAAINPGAPAGPIDRIASGGELSRFLLALKVQLAAQSDGLTMIFDEIDRGVGGATANAVGRRLAQLANAGQVLVVTHSPQVAALGDHHFQISKNSVDGLALTDVDMLDPDQRRDEIARMLAGGEVTDAARLAADALLAEARAAYLI
ncbi:MAG: DNA repair protein RecN [Pseudomonadota bacterium]